MALWVRLIKPFERGRPDLRQTRPPMEIQMWGGAARRCVEAALQSATGAGIDVDEDGGEKGRRSDESEEGVEAKNSAARQGSAGRAKARRVSELGRAVSCRSGDLWRGTKLQVGSREPFEDLHRSAALGAAIQGAGIF